jgi:hypothetical protein
MVREAIGSALPRPRKKPERPRWKLKAAVQFVDAILEADRKAPRKQRHTAHRIWTRMQHELPECKIAERTVREYVHDRKIALGLMVRETCVPQSYAWGVEAQMDWYEAYADLAGERVKLQVFAMRSMASGAAFHCAYLHATQQAFLEAQSRGNDGPWKAWKTKNRFSTLPTVLGNRCAIPTFPPLRRLFLYKGEAQTPSPKNQQLRVGQIKPPKWAKWTCQTQGGDRTSGKTGNDSL